MGHILVTAKDERFTRREFFKNIKRGIRLLDGGCFNSINITCEIETKEEVESLIKFLEISKHCFNK